MSRFNLPSLAPKLSNPLKTNTGVRAVTVWVVVLLLTLPTISTWVYFDLFEGRGWVTQALYFGSKLLQATIPILWVAFVLREDWGRPRWSKASACYGLLVGLVTMVGMIWTYQALLQGTPILAQTPASIMKKLRDFQIDTPLRYGVMAVFLSILHAAFEEYYWRWFVFGQLQQRCHLFWAVFISSMGFAAHHVIVIAKYIPDEYFFSVTIPGALVIASGGAIWAWIYHRTRSLVGAWIAHMFADIGLMWVGFDLCQSMLR